MSKRLMQICAAVVLAVLVLVGCSSGGEEEVVETADLVFSDVKVECSNRDGFFGGRYANFTLTGSVTNKSGNPVNEDNMPKLVASGDDGEEIRADLSQDKLLDSETCDITYEHEFDITRNAMPTLAFSSKLSTEGLEDAETELNSGLGKIAESYAAKDAEKEAKKKAAEEKEQQKKEAAEQARKTIEGCKGKTADEGLKAAKDADYTAWFEDKDGVDVTDDVEDSGNESDVHTAKIVDVTITNFLGDYVTFKLDYEDPEAKKAREEEEAKEAEETRKREEANKVLNTDNCEDLVKLLEVADPGDPFVAEFAEKYNGRKIEFDGVVSYCTHHGSYNTRFDYLIGVGDDPETATRGPNFKFEDINYYDFKWEGESPESVPVGTKLHCVAEVDRYEDTSQLFFLEPIETSVR